MKGFWNKLSAWREKGGIRPYLYLPFVLLAYLGPDFALRYSYQALGLLGMEHPAANLATLGWALALTGLAALLPGKIKRIWMGLSFLTIGVLTVVHSVLQNLFGRFFMFATLAFAGDGMAFVEAQYIKVSTGVILGLLASLFCLLLALLLSPSKGQAKLPPVILSGAVFLAAGIALAAYVQETWLTTQQDVQLGWDNYSDPAAVYESFSDSTSCLLMAGLYQYTIKDLSVTLNLGGDVTAEELLKLEDYAEERRQIRTDNEYTGIFAGKNIMVIQLEAIDTWMLTEEYMPALWALKQESMVFENHYAPAYITAGTFNTEFMVNTGLLPATGSVSTQIYSHNSYPYSLAHMFRAAGYSAQSFHGSEGNVYNRGTIHLNLGYEHYNSGIDMGMEDYTMDSHMLVAYDEMVREDPFFSFIITYSGHGPYHMKTGSYLAHSEQAHELVEEYEGKYIYAVAGAMETDAFVAGLLERLEADDMLEDTVLVFYADHYNYYMLHDAQLMGIKGVDDITLLQHVDFFIYSADQEPQQIEKFTSTPDVLPTIANLFDLERDEAVFVGNDGLSEEGDFVFFIDGGWLDGENYWKPSDPVVDGARNQLVSHIFAMSNLFLRANYYAR